MLLFSSISSLSAQAPIQYGSSDYNGNIHHLKNVAIGTDANNRSKMLWIKAPERLEQPCTTQFETNGLPDFALYIEGKVNECPEDGFATGISRYKPYFTVSSFGRVGIDTDKPDYKFHLQGTGYASHNFYVGDSVGIGTTSPSEKLHVNGNISMGGDNWTALRMDGTGNNDWLLNAHSDGESFHIRSYDENNSQYPNPYRLTIKRNTGYVGIGTTSPNEKLDVEGNISINNGNDWRLYGTASAFAVKDQTANQYRFWINTSNGNVGIGTNSPSARLHVKGSTIIEGDLVIKGNNPFTDGATEIKLSSGGTIRAREIKVDLATIPDYVFAEDYELMPLEEVASFVAKNKHLPNVKSEAEFKEEGSISLTEMNLKLLEKVEELTLYTLQQQEDINTLKVELENLKK